MTLATSVGETCAFTLWIVCNITTIVSWWCTFGFDAVNRKKLRKEREQLRKDFAELANEFEAFKAVTVNWISTLQGNLLAHEADGDPETVGLMFPDAAAPAAEQLSQFVPASRAANGEMIISGSMFLDAEAPTVQFVPASVAPNAGIVPGVATATQDRVISISTAQAMVMRGEVVWNRVIVPDAIDASGSNYAPPADYDSSGTAIGAVAINTAESQPVPRHTSSRRQYRSAVNVGSDTIMGVIDTFNDRFAGITGLRFFFMTRGENGRHRVVFCADFDEAGFSELPTGMSLLEPSLVHGPYESVPACLAAPDPVGDIVTTGQSTSSTFDDSHYRDSRYRWIVRDNGAHSPIELLDISHPRYRNAVGRQFFFRLRDQGDEVGSVDFSPSGYGTLTPDSNPVADFNEWHEPYASRVDTMIAYQALRTALSSQTPPWVTAGPGPRYVRVNSRTGSPYETGGVLDTTHVQLRGLSGEHFFFSLISGHSTIYSAVFGQDGLSRVPPAAIVIDPGSLYGPYDSLAQCIIAVSAAGERERERWAATVAERDREALGIEAVSAEAVSALRERAAAERERVASADMARSLVAAAYAAAYRVQHPASVLAPASAPPRPRAPRGLVRIDKQKGV